MKKINCPSGFTLIEILFVLLVIALVTSFAAPAIRAVRLDMKNSQAKAALKKLAEARRTYYQRTKGVDVTGTFSTSAVRGYAGQACVDRAASGIPAPRSNSAEPVAAAVAPINQLFACQFLNWKDFAGLPYTFYLCPLAETGTSPCNETGRYAAAVGTEEAGTKYHQDYVMYIGADMEIQESEEEEEEE